MILPPCTIRYDVTKATRPTSRFFLQREGDSSRQAAERYREPTCCYQVAMSIGFSGFLSLDMLSDCILGWCELHRGPGSDEESFGGWCQIRQLVDSKNILD